MNVKKKLFWVLFGYCRNKQRMRGLYLRIANKVQAKVVYFYYKTNIAVLSNVN